MKSNEVLASAAAYTHKWYRAYPTTEALAAWIASSKGLVYTVAAEEGMTYKVTLVDDPTVTGAVMSDKDTKTIVIGRIYVATSQLALQDVDKALWPTVSLLASNGTVIHESAHIRYNSLEAWHILSVDEMVPPAHRGIMRNLTNVVEDLYIEAMVRQEFEPLTPFVEGKNAYLFCDRQVSQEMVSVNEATGLMPRSVISVLTMMKRFTDCSHVAMIASEMARREAEALCKIAAKVFTFTPTTSVTDRYAVAFELYTAIKRMLTADEMIELAGDVVDTEAGAATAAKALMAASAGIPGTIESVTTVKGEVEAAVTVTGVSGSDKGEAAILKAAKAIRSMDEIEVDPSGAVTLVATAPEGEDEFEMDDRYREIAKHFQQMATQSTTFGPARTKGQLVNTRLYRIATDGKVCGTREDTVKFKKDFEVTVLIDYSGSMTGYRKRTGTRLSAALAAALGIKYSLDAANIKCNLYAHTADLSVIEGNNLVMIKVAPHEARGSIRTAARRAYSLNTATRADTLYPYENRDGSAIEWVKGNGFSKGNSNRVLLVISDGAPAAQSYYGDGAINHTRKAVDATRREGIKVISISITSDANSTNELIYGPQFNVFNEDPDVIVKVVEQIMQGNR